MKKNRQKHRMFLAEGKKLTQEALDSDVRIEAVICREDQLTWGQELKLGEIPLMMAEQQQFDQLHDLQQAEGVLAVIHLPAYLKEQMIPTQATLLLEEIQDPGNMGTLIRTADWFGIRNIFCSKGCVDVYNPKVLRASMGSIFRVKVNYLADWEEGLSGMMDRLYIAHMEGKSLDQLELSPDSCILIGNEARGVKEEWLTHPKVNKVAIPGVKGAESLNAAVAGSVLMWEWFKQHNKE
ncbi:MAG: RNA methyltransferase [Bacteroidota bacterium]